MEQAKRKRSRSRSMIGANVKRRKSRWKGMKGIKGGAGERGYREEQDEKRKRGVRLTRRMTVTMMVMTTKRGKVEEAQTGEGNQEVRQRKRARQTNCVASQFILPLMSFVLISF